MLCPWSHTHCIAQNMLRGPRSRHYQNCKLLPTVRLSPPVLQAGISKTSFEEAQSWPEYAWTLGSLRDQCWDHCSLFSIHSPLHPSSLFLTHPLSFSPIPSLFLTQPLFLTHSLSFSPKPSLYLTHPLSFSPTHSLFLTHILSLSHPHTLSLSLSLTHTCSLSHPHPLSFSSTPFLFLTHTLSLSHPSSLSLFLTHPLSFSPTFSLFLSHLLSLSHPHPLSFSPTSSLSCLPARLSRVTSYRTFHGISYCAQIVYDYEYR